LMAKAIGAGFPVAALGGRREVMEQAADGRTMHGGTYNSNMLVCAAVIAACRETGADGFYERLNARGARLGDGLVEIAHAAGMQACWSGVGALFQLWFSAQPPRDYREAHAVAAESPFFTLHRELRDRGVLIQPPQEGLWLMSAAHTDADIDRTLEAAADAMPAVAAALAAGSVGPMGGLR
jgi:glutamate-1-semialdehyde 2,1-aminomutase